MATWSSAVFAAPLPPSLVVASGAACNVELVAASYDDPGADDAEFVELRVLTGGTPPFDGGDSSASPPTSQADGGDAGRDASSAPVLGDCGLSRLDLIDGASGGCATYRSIPLADVPQPEDGFVVLCAAGSTVDAAAHCDVTSAGRSQLRAGWLQNGPNDGLRFIGNDGSARDVGYEGAPACFAPNAPLLATESGESEAGSAVDDVNAWCGGKFVLLPTDDVGFRAAPVCPRPPPASIAPGVDTRARLDAGADGSEVARDGGWVPERAPPPMSRGPSRRFGPLFVDAGTIGAPHTSPALPKPPGCSSSARAAPGGGVNALPLLVAVACGWFVRRRRADRERVVGYRITRRLRSPLAAAPRSARARCDARCDSWRCRSPSR
jgi:hypothetical protein